MPWFDESDQKWHSYIVNGVKPNNRPNRVQRSNPDLAQLGKIRIS